MSFFSLDDVYCGPIRPRKRPQVVIGTVNTPWGYRVKERTKCHLVKRPPSFEHYEEEKRREIEHLEKVLDFADHSNVRIKKKKIKQHVLQGLAEHKGAVNTRREKLREILLKEEMGLIHEVIYQAQHGDDARMDEIRRRTEEIRKEQEEQRLALVAAKRMQQYFLQCPEVREKLSKKTTFEAKQGNLAQMADNEAKRQAEKELDDMWHQLMLKEVEAKKEREVEEVKRRVLAQEDDMSVLAKQIAGKLALEEKKKQVTKDDAEHLKRLLEEFRQEELRRLEMERENREKLKKELQEQILIAKRKLAEEARHEEEMDRMRGMIAAEELAREQASIKESSAALRKELLAFLEYLEELRKEEAKKELEMDQIIEESLKDVSHRRDQAVTKFRQAREKIMQDVLETREEQMRLKCEREKEEQRQRQLEKEMLEAEMESEAKLAAHAKEERKNKMLRYRKELEEQWKWTKDTRRQELEADKKAYMEELKRQEEYQKLTDELLSASENITPHPFKILLRECAARYAAEKEGRCYCPPPLNED